MNLASIQLIYMCPASAPPLHYNYTLIKYLALGCCTAGMHRKSADYYIQWPVVVGVT